MALGNIQNEYPDLAFEKLSYRLAPSKQIMTDNHQDTPMTMPTSGGRYARNLPK